MIYDEKLKSVHLISNMYTGVNVNIEVVCCSIGSDCCARGSGTLYHGVEIGVHGGEVECSKKQRGELSRNDVTVIQPIRDRIVFTSYYSQTTIKPVEEAQLPSLAPTAHWHRADNLSEIWL